MKTSFEISRDVPLVHMRQYMALLGLTDDDFDFYGKYTGKIRLEWLDKMRDRPDGKLILVTAMTPTSRGEGKTLTSVGIGQAIGRLGRRGMIALREPSLGPVFGMKGGATGGGYAQVIPMEDINLHFNGDIHAITAAHNLLAAMLDNHIYQGNEKRIDVTRVLWPRAMDMNDRALRHIVVGLGGKTNGVPRETGVVITAASEVMAILALATGREDLKKRLGDIVVANDVDGQAVTARDIGADRAMAVVLKDAIQPNLVQTIEHTPALVHAGPFANIAHGTSSVVAARTALKLADYVVTECGFAADLGGEKFFDIVCRQSGLYPNAVVIVATTRAIKRHGGVAEKPADLLEKENPAAFEAGLANLGVHIRSMKKFGVPIVVALNRYPFDTEQEIATLRRYCEGNEVAFAPHDAFMKGGDGAVELAGDRDETGRLQPHAGAEIPLRARRDPAGEGAPHRDRDLRRGRRLLREGREDEAGPLRQAGLRQAPGVHREDPVLALGQREAPRRAQGLHGDGDRRHPLRRRRLHRGGLRRHHAHAGTPRGPRGGAHGYRRVGEHHREYLFCSRPRYIFSSTLRTLSSMVCARSVRVPALITHDTRGTPIPCSTSWQRLTAANTASQSPSMLVP